VLSFLLAVAILVFLIRWAMRQQTPERAAVWAGRWERLAPIGRHVLKDIRHTRLNIREARAARRFKKGF
jgi:hypothetical protein